MTGYSGNVGTGLFDYLTLKYDISGTLEWAQMFDNPAAGSQDDTAYSIALDGLGSVYVVGRSHNGSNRDMVTVRYDSAGTQQWAGTIDNGGQDYGTAMAVGPNGAIVVAGTSDGLGQDYVVAKYVAAESNAPIDPAIVGTSPLAGSWTNDSTVEVTWSGAADNLGGSGLAGYSIEWNHTAVSTPDAVVDVPHTSDPHTTTGAALTPDGNDWYFHLRTCDVAGNCTSTVHAGPFWIDIAAPGAVAGLHSTSHWIGVPSLTTQIDLAFAASTDGLSGVDGYAVAVDGSPSWTCDGAKDLEEGALSFSEGVTPGTWYAHVCALDNAGNSGAVSTSGPYVVDGAAPSPDLFVYYSRIGAGEIRRVRANGFDDGLVLGGLSAPLGLAIDPRGGKIYVALAGTNAIARCNLNGTGLETLVELGGRAVQRGSRRRQREGLLGRARCGADSASQL